MSKPMSVILTVILSLLILTGSPVQAAQERVADQSVKLVVMDVQVLKKQTTRAVGDLKKEDFVVYEDGIKQGITLFPPPASAWPAPHAFNPPGLLKVSENAAHHVSTDPGAGPLQLGQTKLTQ